VYVSAFNHGFDPREYVQRVPHGRIAQIHLAGHTHRGTHILDTHRGPVIDAVWDLYRETIEKTGPVSTLVEWDDEIPELSVVLAEAEKARTVRDEVLAAVSTKSLIVQRRGAPESPARADAARAISHGGGREIASSE
jgi:uncharacterized protein (UPF0276 family)